MNSSEANQIAKKRCEKLLKLSEEAWRKGEKAFARRYVKLARAIAMRHRFPLGQRRFCKKCDAPLVPGLTLKTRLSSGKKTVLYICTECGAVSKKGYGKRA